MKIIGKTILSFFLVALILTSCMGFLSTTAINPTGVMGTAISTVETAVVETQTAMPTFAPTVMSLPTQLPTETPIPLMQSSPVPVSGSPITVISENGITWTECVAPYRDYAHDGPTITFAVDCLNMDMPYWTDNDREMAGERIDGNNGSDLRLVIGNDVFLAKHNSANGCCDYEFLKNGDVIMETSAPLITFDPNRNLWNIGGKSVWELITDPPTIVVDGINFNEKYQLEGVFVPYMINNKLIYIAKKNGKYHVVYDEKVIGTEFDEIYIKYCCATTQVFYGDGRYWFWGKRDGTYYVVGIH
jgi:hypothetical protein